MEDRLVTRCIAFLAAVIEIYGQEQSKRKGVYFGPLSVGTVHHGREIMVQELGVANDVYPQEAA